MCSWWTSRTACRTAWSTPPPCRLRPRGWRLRRPAGCSEAREAIGTLPLRFPPPCGRRILDRPCRAKTGGTDEIVPVRRSELPERVVSRGSGGRMRKIVVQMMLSLDGYFEGPDHDLSWHLVDEELHAHFNEQLATMSAFVEGRVSYELMEAVWPTADQDPDYPPTMREFAGIWRAVPKIVFSRTLQEVGPNASLRAEVDPDEIRALKQQPGGDMTLGGVDLVDTFRRLDLVDEYRLYVNPVVIGRGRRLFETADNPTDLELVENRRFGNGVVLLRYAVRRL